MRRPSVGSTSHAVALAMPGGSGTDTQLVPAAPVVPTSEDMKMTPVDSGLPLPV